MAKELGDVPSCNSCGSPYRLHSHHIIPKKYGGTNARHNLVTLCTKCHGKIHSDYGTKAIMAAFEADRWFFAKCFIALGSPHGDGA